MINTKKAAAAAYDGAREDQEGAYNPWRWQFKVCKYAEEIAEIWRSVFLYEVRRRDNLAWEINKESAGAAFCTDKTVCRPMTPRV